MLGVGDAATVAPETADAVVFVTEDGVPGKVRLADAWPVRFEAMAPVRFAQAAAASAGPLVVGAEGHHVGYESWLERDHVMSLDFDPLVVGIASQPFWLSRTDQDDTVRSYAPDYFARRADGSAVVDCRPIERRKPRDAAAFEATRRACELLGWEYRLVGAAEPILVRNARWLAGYRHLRYNSPGSSEPSPEPHLVALPRLPR
jgi:hypothetical protein